MSNQPPYDWANNPDGGKADYERLAQRVVDRLGTSQGFLPWSSDRTGRPPRVGLGAVRPVSARVAQAAGGGSPPGGTVNTAART